MPKISKHQLIKEVEDLIWKKLVEVFREAKSNEAVLDILRDLFTPSERIIFSKRLAIAFFLNKNLSYAQIIDLLKVSSATVNHVKNAMRRHGKGYLLATSIRNSPVVEKILSDKNKT